MAMALRSAMGGLAKWKLTMENILIPISALHTSSVHMKQRNPFSMAEAGQLKLRGRVERKKKTSGGDDEKRLTGTNDVVYRKNLPRVFHSWETGAAYLKSQTYFATYGELPVWTNYRRNFRGGADFIPRPRPSCFTKDNKFTLNNPCPLCRDEYLVVDYRNPELLKQFINDITGEILDVKKTGLCEMQLNEVRANTILAKENGSLPFDVPFRNYDYRHYYVSLSDESDEEAFKNFHVVKVPDRPRRYPEKRPYAYVKYPVHAPMTISDYEL